VPGSSTLRAPLSLLLLLVGCAPAGSGVSGARFDLCQPLVVVPDASATADELAGLGQALALWNQDAGARLSLPGADASASATADAPSLPQHFQMAAGNFHGLYDPATVQVFINLDLAGHELAVTIAHELGHAYGLVHVSPDVRASVMNPANLTVEPTAADAAALAAIWGTCSP